MASIILTEISQSLKDRFHQRYDRRGNDECWNWTARCNPQGYGLIYTLVGGAKKVIFATHVALELDGRRRQPDQVACHACDNPTCVNPKHLRWGSIRDNSRDMVERGRAPQGEASPRAILSDEQVRAIRADPRRRSVIAREYGLSWNAINLIVRRKRWAHLS